MAVERLLAVMGLVGLRACWCLEHERPIAKCSELAWRDYGVWLFSNCEADAKTSDTGAAVNGPRCLNPTPTREGTYAVYLPQL